VTFAHQSGHTLRTHVLVMGLAFGTSLLVARSLGSAERGVLALGQQLFSLSVLLGGLGWDAGLRFAIARSDRPREEILARVVPLAGLALLTVPLAYGLGFLLGRESFLGGLRPEVLLGFALLLPLNVINATFTALLYGDGHLLPLNRTQTLGTALRLGAILALVAGGRLDVVGVIAVTGLVEVVTLLLLGRSLRRHVGPPRWPGSTSGAGTTLRSGLEIMLVQLVQWLNLRLDVFFVSALLDVRAVGTYAVAVSLAELVSRTGDALARPLFPRVARGTVSASDTAAAARATLLLMAGLAVVLLAPARIAVAVVGPGYEGLLSSLVLLLPGTVLLATGNVLTAHLTGSGRARIPLSINVMAVTLNVMLDLWWIPRLGIEGAALASTASYGAVALGATVALARVEGLPIATILVPGPRDVALVAGRLREFLRGVLTP